jgi:glutamine synthetase
VLTAGIQGIQEGRRLEHFAEGAGEEDENAAPLPLSLNKALQAFGEDTVFISHRNAYTTIYPLMPAATVIAL